MQKISFPGGANSQTTCIFGSVPDFMMSDFRLFFFGISKKSEVINDRFDVPHLSLLTFDFSPVPNSFSFIIKSETLHKVSGSKLKS